MAINRKVLRYCTLLAATALGITSLTFVATIGFLALSAFGVVAA